MGFFVVATIFISCTYDANVIILVRMVGRDWIRRQTKTTYCFCLLAIKADSRGFTNELTQDVHGAQRENQESLIYFMCPHTLWLRGGVVPGRKLPDVMVLSHKQPLSGKV